MPGSPDGDGPGWKEEPSQLEELADFMEQVPRLAQSPDA